MEVRHWAFPAGRPDLFSLLEGRVPGALTNGFGSPLPVFRLQKVEDSIDYSRNALGFERQWRADEGFVCIARDHCSIFLTRDNQSQPRIWLWIGVENGRAPHR